VKRVCVSVTLRTDLHPGADDPQTHVCPVGRTKYRHA
jgi:hypothetical protein